MLRKVAKDWFVVFAYCFLYISKNSAGFCQPLHLFASLQLLGAHIFTVFQYKQNSSTAVLIYTFLFSDNKCETVTQRWDIGYMITSYPLQAVFHVAALYY